MKQYLFLALCLITISAHSKNPSLSEQVQDHFKNMGHVVVDKTNKNIFTLKEEFEQCNEKYQNQKHSKTACLQEVDRDAKEMLSNDAKLFLTTVVIDIPVFIAAGLLQDAGVQSTAKGVRIGFGGLTGIPTLIAVAEILPLMILRSKIKDELKETAKMK